MNISFKKFLPPNSLRKYIQYFWAVEGVIPAPHTERFIPGGSVQLGFDLQDENYFYTNPGDINLRPKMYVEGTFNRSFFVKYGTNVKSFGALFFPGCFHMLFDYRFNEGKDKIVPADEIFGRDILELYERIGAASTDAESIETMSAYLTNRIKSSQFSNPHIERIFNKGDLLMYISLIQKKDNWFSERHTRRLFKNFLGMSPKMFSRIVRLEDTIRTVKNSKANLTNSCLRHGYFDQAHFINDFKKIVGLTPGKYLEECNHIDQHYFNS